jgi:hypothetical protein
VHKASVLHVLWPLRDPKQLRHRPNSLRATLNSNQQHCIVIHSSAFRDNIDSCKGIKGFIISPVASTATFSSSLLSALYSNCCSPSSVSVCAQALLWYINLQRRLKDCLDTAEGSVQKSRPLLLNSNTVLCMMCWYTGVACITKG